MAAYKLLVVDHDFEARESLTLLLERSGYIVYTADNGYGALQLANELHPDLIILDAILPELNGYEVCKEIRKTSYVPIMFISSKDEDRDIVFGLTIDGDDYLTKPFSQNQLIARVNALLRRVMIHSSTPLYHHLIRHSGFEMDLNNRTVSVGGRLISLSSKEFDLLSYMAAFPNTVFRLEHLFQHVWNSDSFGDTRTLMVHISNLRKKIEPDPTNPRYIVTVRGVGYKFLA
ncbi:response regulator transcription factor [Paenibacillus marinisediminis]